MRSGSPFRGRSGLCGLYVGHTHPIGGISRTGTVRDGLGTLARRRNGYRTLDAGAVGCCTCTTRPGPPSPAAITVWYRRTSGVLTAGSTILRIALTLHNTAATVGFAMGPARDSTAA